MNKLIIFILLCGAAIPTTVAFADLGQIIQTIEGVESDTKGSVVEVNAHTLAALKQLGIQQTGTPTTDNSGKQTIKGTKSGINVEVTLSPSSVPNQTHVIVSAKQGELNWNKDFAKQVLSQIVQAR